MAGTEVYKIYPQEFSFSANAAECARPNVCFDTNKCYNFAEAILRPHPVDHHIGWFANEAPRYAGKYLRVERRPDENIVIFNRDGEEVEISMSAPFTCFVETPCPNAPISFAREASTGSAAEGGRRRMKKKTRKSRKGRKGTRGRKH